MEKKHISKNTKFKFHIPTQRYGFLEVEGNISDIKSAEIIYNHYAEVPLKFQKGKFIEVKTFTGETIRYNSETHKYTDLEGNVLISGSQYGGSLKPKFPIDDILPKMEKKYGVSAQTIKEMWSINSKTSTLFGEALHSAMEQWFLHRKNGTEKEYHIAKHPFLREAVMKFPLKDKDALPEVIVSAVKIGRVGRIDLLTLTGEKEAIVEDYKSDSDIKKNVDGHFNQLSFYASILQYHGWSVPKVRVWNYAANGWESFESPVLEIKTKQ